MVEETFEPKPSKGAWSLVGIAAFTGSLLLPVLFALEEVRADGEMWAVWIAAAVVVPLAVFFLLTAVAFRDMRYELEPDDLVLRFGWLTTYRIPYRDITSMETRDLRPSPLSSMRLPGLALWTVQYIGEGFIVMVSSRSAKGITLITTAPEGGVPRRYGISPDQEDRFRDALEWRIERAGRQAVEPVNPAPFDS